MHFQYLFLAVLSGLSFAAAAAVPYNFRLLAVTPRDVTPRISHSVDIVDGVIGTNRTTTAATFTMYRPPTLDLPMGRLSTASNSSAHLRPDNKHPGFWDFVVGRERKDDGVWKGYRITDLSCGFSCGGLQLVHGDGRGQGRTEWVAIPEGDAWVLKWWGSDTPPEGIPGAVGVWLVKDGV